MMCQLCAVGRDASHDAEVAQRTADPEILPLGTSQRSHDVLHAHLVQDLLNQLPLHHPFLCDSLQALFSRYQLLSDHLAVEVVFSVIPMVLTYMASFRQDTMQSVRQVEGLSARRFHPICDDMVEIIWSSSHLMK